MWLSGAFSLLLTRLRLGASGAIICNLDQLNTSSPKARIACEREIRAFFFNGESGGLTKEEHTQKSWGGDQLR
jgi:hypothetical protein